MDKWHGCYDDGWQGIIVPEAFAHPAKMSYALTRRIFKHALGEGWIKPGDICIDPFGGVGSTGIVGASLGLRVVCVELEQKFVDLANQNFERNRKAFECGHFGHSYLPVMICGDSRNLQSIIEEVLLCKKVQYAQKSMPKETAIGRAEVSGGEDLLGNDSDSLQKSETDTHVSCATAQKNIYESIINEDQRTEKNGTILSKTSKHFATPVMPKNTILAANNNVKSNAESVAGNSGREQETQIFVQLNVAEQDGDRKTGNVLDISAMKPGSVDAVVSSPPYAETLKGDGEGDIERRLNRMEKAGIDVRRTKGNRGGVLKKHSKTDGYGYSSTPGNLGNLKPGEVSAVIGSPPFQQSLQSGDTSSSFKTKYPDAKTGGDWGQSYGNTPGNIAAMPPGEVDAVVSSPPYEGTGLNYAISGNQKRMRNAGLTDGRSGCGLNQSKHSFTQDYGNSEGQLGQEQGDTFWQAARQIVSECHKILKPGGHAIWVVKAFVRKGKLVDFPGDWQRLCEAQGFQTVCLHHAMLVKESTHSGLFEDITVKKERKSFFRRLAEAKGSPPIDFETVICMRKSS